MVLDRRRRVTHCLWRCGRFRWAALRAGLVNCSRLWPPRCRGCSWYILQALFLHAVRVAFERAKGLCSGARKGRAATWLLIPVVLHQLWLPACLFGSMELLCLALHSRCVSHQLRLLSIALGVSRTSRAQ